MSKIIGKQDWRELSHYVETDNGTKYYVDSCYVGGRGLETLVCLVNDGLNFTPGSFSTIEKYSYYDEMVEQHYNICENLEKWLDDRGKE